MHIATEAGRRSAPRPGFAQQPLAARATRKRGGAGEGAKWGAAEAMDNWAWGAIRSAASEAGALGGALVARTLGCGRWALVLGVQSPLH